MEVVWIPGLVVFWLDLKIYCICCLRSNVSIKSFHRSELLACTFIRSLLHFFPQLSWFKKLQWWYLNFRGISALRCMLWTEFFSSSASGLPLIFVTYSAVLSSLGISLIIFLTCSSVPCKEVPCGAMQGNHSQYQLNCRKMFIRIPQKWRITNSGLFLSWKWGELKIPQLSKKLFPLTCKIQHKNTKVFPIIDVTIFCRNCFA